MPTAVCGIVSKERFPNEEEGVFMRRLFSFCAGLALIVGGFAGVRKRNSKMAGRPSS